MKSSRLSQSLTLLLPILCILLSVGIVVLQSARHERLKKELTSTEREYARLEKRYKELKYPNQANAPVEERHTHEHHDGDGD